MSNNALQITGLLRLSQIIGNPKADPPIPALIPISKSAWWEGCKNKRFPAPVKLGPRTTCWRRKDIQALIDGTYQPENKSDSLITEK